MPWHAALPSEHVAAGAFLAEIGSEYPGAGWFEAGEARGSDASRAAVHETSAQWPVVQIQLFGWTPDG